MQPASLTSAVITNERRDGEEPPLATLGTTASSTFSHSHSHSQSHPISSLVSVSIPGPGPSSVGLPQSRRHRRHILLDVESGRGRRLLNILTSHAAPMAPTASQVHQAAKQSALRERLEQERAEQEERDRQEREERRREREEQEQARLRQERERLDVLWTSYHTDLSLHRRTSTQPALYWCPAGEDQ